VLGQIPVGHGPQSEEAWADRQEQLANSRFAPHRTYKRPEGLKDIVCRAADSLDLFQQGLGTVLRNGYHNGVRMQSDHIVHCAVAPYIHEPSASSSDIAHQSCHKGRIVIACLGEKDNVILRLELLDERIQLRRTCG